LIYQHSEVRRYLLVMPLCTFSIFNGRKGNVNHLEIGRFEHPHHRRHIEVE